MKEKDIREAINKFNTTDCSIPYTVVAYATGFPSGVYVYAAPVPAESIKWPDVYQPWTTKPIQSEEAPEPVDMPKLDKPQVDKCELDELIDAVLALKAQTVEIYKLKALACAIRERNA